MFDRITFDPQIMGGRACIRGMRITVSLIVNLVANGMSTEEILREYPILEAEDIRQALQHAASLPNEEIHIEIAAGGDGRGQRDISAEATTPPSNRARRRSK